jgi:hypothetical protein
MDANKQMKKARHKGGGENDIEIEFEDRDTTMQHTSFVDKRGQKATISATLVSITKPRQKCHQIIMEIVNHPQSQKSRGGCKAVQYSHP